MPKTTNPILAHFSFDHLPTDLAEISKPFGALARKVARNNGAQTDMALTHLLIAKDAAVRAALEARVTE